MFFYASKILSWLVWPSSIVMLLLIVGAACVLSRRAECWGRRLLATGVVLLLVLGYAPVSKWLVLPLEQRFPRETPPADLEGVIILGGFEDIHITQARRDLALNDASERLIEGGGLALRRPQAKVVFAGGDNAILKDAGSAAPNIGDYLADIGIARQRIVLESRSRTTWENAHNLAEMLQPKPGQRFALVTSAFHMPRAVGAFRKAGFDVVAWPVDYRTTGVRDALVPSMNAANGLSLADLALKEWVGLLAYRLSGRSSTVWPGPARARGS